MRRSLPGFCDCGWFGDRSVGRQEHGTGPRGFCQLRGTTRVASRGTTRAPGRPVPDPLVDSTLMPHLRLPDGRGAVAFVSVSGLAVESTVAAMAEAVREGRVTARTLTEQSVAAIADHDASIGAFQLVRARRALEEADVVDGRDDRGGLALAGVPLAVKDNVAVSGEPMRIGSTASDPTARPADHPVVARLRAAGAVIVGLTRLPELAVWPVTDSAFGTTRNPWDLDRTAGGSSGGSAAAVAAGMVAGAHGNDALGSIRIPAACCGLVGIKPGSGLVPSELGKNSWFGLGENGPLTRTVTDAALLLSVMAGVPDLAKAPTRQPGRLRIAVAVRPPTSWHSG